MIEEFYPQRAVDKFIFARFHENLSELLGIVVPSVVSDENVHPLAAQSVQRGAIVLLEVSDKGFLFSLNRMECCSDFTSGFVRTFGFSFLQSHANPKTAVYCQDIFVPDYLFSPTT